MHCLAVGSLLRDAEVMTSNSGNPYCRATLRESTNGFAPVLFAVYAHNGSPAFEVLRQAKRGDAISVQGVLRVHMFEERGAVKPAIDLAASLIVPLNVPAAGQSYHSRDTPSQAQSDPSSPMKELISQLK